MPGRPPAQAERARLVRDADGADILEALIVASVASLLAIRGFLALTNYPQLGGAGLHIAHMLWGGFFLLVAVILAVSYWSPAVRWTAGILGGIGFGTFIDELGKFITADNDYFYQPTIALIYAIFVALFLMVRILYARRPLSAREREINERMRGLLIAGGDSAWAARYRAWRTRLAQAYQQLTARRAFGVALAALFVGAALARVVTVVTVILGGGRGDETVHAIQAVANAASGAFVVVGALRLPRSRLAAYRWFQRSLLVSILVVQFFLFLESELAALGGLAADLLLYGALGYMIRREEEALPSPGEGISAGGGARR